MADTMQTEDFPYLPSGLAEVNKMIAEHSDLFSDSQCKVCSAVLISESQKLTHYQSKKHSNKVRRYFFIQNENEPTLKKPSTIDNDCNNGETDRFKACVVCNMTFTSAVMAESHYQGKVHAKNLRLKTVGPQTPGAQTPGAQTPGAQTPGAQTPGAQTPGAQTPGAQTPGAQTPGAQTPGAQTPGAQTPGAQTPGAQTPGAQTPGAQTIGPQTQQTTALSQTSPVPAKKQKTGVPLHDKSDPNHFCSVCQASFNNPLMAQQHYQGKKHQKHMKKQKLMETYGPAKAPATMVKGYPCSLCNIELNSVEQYQSHISGAKHKTAMKKSGLSPSAALQVADSFSTDLPEPQLPSGADQVFGDDQWGADSLTPAEGDQWGADSLTPAEGDQWGADSLATAEEDPGFCEEYQTFSKN